MILVPRRSGNPERDALWEFTKAWWAKDHPSWPIVEGYHDDGPFNRSAAINTAARLAGDWDVAVVIDADVLCDPNAVDAAVDVAITGSMVIAGDERIHLTQRGSAKIRGGYRGDWRATGIAEKAYLQHWSSCVVVSRRLWDDVGGFDERFVGWGYEDDAFRWACETISGRPLVKISATIWHLWHATQPNPATTRNANRDRSDRYLAARGDLAATRALLDEPLDDESEPRGPDRSVVVTVREPIPRTFHRTVPKETSADVEDYWAGFRMLHPDWEFCTYREPLDPKSCPLTGDLWPRCTNGAQKAGLIRLEVLVTYGGVYVDSDVEPVRSFEPLLAVPAFAAWEDSNVVPDAVLGAVPQHPAFVEALGMARAIVERGGGAWDSGPGVTTKILPGRSDVLLLPPGAFYPYHYLEADRSANDGPWVFARHHWSGSWLSDAQRAANEKRRR